MDTKLLKQKILDLAIHGKLVPQNPNDESATVLLEKIRAEKAEKIKKGELKADKKDSFIFVGDDNRHYEKFADGTVKDIEDEIPFEVPEGWAWCRLPNICREKITDGTHNSPPNERKGDFLYITAKNIKFSGVDLTDVSYVSKEIHDVIYNRCSPVKNDVLLTKDGTIGEATVNNLDYPFSLLSSVALIKTANSILPWYIVYVLKSDYLQKKMIKEAKGTALKRIILDQINSFLVPLPPLNEQKEIISQVKKNLTLIDSIDNDKSDLQTAIKQTKSKILDLAIHGKLVPQDSSDEPASVLLERLRAEKEAKIKAGELKRDKNDSYIYMNTTDNCHYQKFINGNETDITDEIPFEIPDNWSWCNLGEIYSHTTGKALKKENNKGILRKYITTSNLYWNCFDFTDVRTMYFTDDELEKCTIKKGDLVLCNGGDVGRAAIWKLDEDICYQNHVSRLRPRLSGINNSFYLYVIQINKEKGNLSGKGVGITSLSATDILNLKIPLPPLAEQKRIVEKIENFYSILDKIAENLA